jgi:hypothetical protein
MPTPTPEDRYQEELLLSRRILRDEMRRAIRAIRPDDKRNLVAEWKTRYSPVLAKELLKVAKNPEARRRISEWNLEAFDKERMGAKK